MAGSRKVSVPGETRLNMLSCSFCGKDKDAVTRLVAGPGVFICNECVDVLRARGISWTRTGQALGVSKQAAWERFSGED